MGCFFDQVEDIEGPEPNMDRFDDPELNRDWDNEDNERIFDSPEVTFQERLDDQYEQYDEED